MVETNDETAAITKEFNANIVSTHYTYSKRKKQDLNSFFGHISNIYFTFQQMKRLTPNVLSISSALAAFFGGLV
jgi:hypothetical protein